MPVQKLDEISKIDSSGNNYFHIYCNKNKNKRMIYLSKEDANDLLDKIKNKTIYTKERYDKNEKYTL